jgi:hypothetical protein
MGEASSEDALIGHRATSSARCAANRRIRKAELRRKRLPRYQSLAEDNVGLQIDNHAAIAR